MKIQIAINGTKLATAQISGKGHLGAHVNLDDKKGTGTPKMDVITSGWDTNDFKVTKYADWPSKDLSVGDEVLIRILPDDSTTADAPKQWTLSNDENRTMIESAEIADRILKVAYRHNCELNQLLFDLKDEPTDADMKKLKRAIGLLLMQNFDELIDPILRKHPDKVPEDMKDMPR